VSSSIGHTFSLIGQAKQVAAPITAPTARSFIGAIDTAGVQHAVGLFVSTAGFTQQAISALGKSRYPIVTWGMTEILAKAAPIATRQVDISFTVPDETFWSEISG
jgi:nicotinic acid phosphoribosyltransferase